MFSFGEITDNVAIILQRKGDTDYRTKIKNWVNFSLDYAYRAYDYYAELESIYEFNLVANQESYFMPSYFGMPLRAYDFTNNRKLSVWTEESYTDANIANISGLKTGTSDKIRLFGISAISKALSSGVTVKAKSSSNVDTSGIIIRIEGYVDSSLLILDYEEILLDSTSPTTYATATSPKTFYSITRITKSADTDGYVTIADSSSNVLALIPSTERASRYPVIKFGIIPSAIATIRMLHKRRINKLVNDNDYPFIDADEFFICNAVAYGMAEEKEATDKATLMFQKAKDALSQVIRTEQTRLGEDYQHKIVTKFSQAHRV